MADRVTFRLFVKLLILILYEISNTPILTSSSLYILCIIINLSIATHHNHTHIIQLTQPTQTNQATSLRISLQHRFTQLKTLGPVFGMPPEYGTATYWNTRFAADPTAYEWLVSPSTLHNPIIDALAAAPSPSPRVLHIGCGSSELSYHLRYLVDTPAQVHNVDFSPEAVALGKKHDDAKEPMHWTAADLLDYEDVMALGSTESPEQRGFDVVVDKGTADAVACAYHKRLDGEHVELIREVAVGKGEKGHDNGNAVGDTVGSKIHPEALLMVHLAKVTAKGARWICVSFSATRFDFLEEVHTVQSHEGGKPVSFRAGDLWEVESRVTIEVADEEPETDDGRVVGRPKIQYWLYVLRRV